MPYANINKIVIICKLYKIMLIIAHFQSWFLLLFGAVIAMHLMSLFLRTVDNIKIR